MFVSGEPAFTPAGFVDDGDLENGTEDITQGGSEREGFDEAIGIGGAIGFDDDERADGHGHAEDGVNQTPGVIATDAACGEALNFRAEAFEGESVDVCVEKIIEEDIGSAWAGDESWDQLADECGFPGTEETSNDEDGNALGGRGHAVRLLNGRMR